MSGAIEREFKMAARMYSRSRDIAAYIDGLYAGFRIAMQLFGIWKDGERTIGCLSTPIVTVLREATAAVEAAKLEHETDRRTNGQTENG